ncbi:MAG: hypothetical protein HY303_18095 [Candidatus Wallbacteria bacterium]|nr:hypothetical protein [Candidatus Wallbacteria bacterium]
MNDEALSREYAWVLGIRVTGTVGQIAQSAPVIPTQPWLQPPIFENVCPELERFPRCALRFERLSERGFDDALERRMPSCGQAFGPSQNGIGNINGCFQMG